MLQLSEIVIASENKGKIKEINYVLENLSIKILTPSVLGISIPSSLESFSTFNDNAKAKGDFIFEKTLKPTLSDDSGLIVPALNGEPGVFSKRYSPSGLDPDNRKKLIEEIKNLSEKERIAKFVCVLYFRIANKSFFFEGEANGLILTEERGKEGFGYDPIFYDVEREKTFAEMSFYEKLAVSHRGIALKKFKTFLLENYS
jgi:XTP/dITP diphosphohydrolase